MARDGGQCGGPWEIRFRQKVKRQLEKELMRAWGLRSQMGP